MKTNIAKTLIESFGLVQEAADPAKVQRFIQLVNSGKMSGELIDLQRQLRPEMMSSDALAQAFSKMNGMMGDKIAANKNPQAAPKPSQPRPGNVQPAPKAGSDPKVLQLQKSLIAKGAKIAADGIMGPQTQAAMKQFGQKPAAPGQPVATAQKPAPGVGGGLQQAPADDMPTPKPDTIAAPLSAQSSTSDIVKSVSQLPPQQIADLHNKLKDKYQKQSFLTKDYTDPMFMNGVSQQPADGKMTPELQSLINKNKNDVVGYVHGMKAQNQKKG